MNYQSRVQKTAKYLSLVTLKIQISSCSLQYVMFSTYSCNVYKARCTSATPQGRAVYYLGPHARGKWLGTPLIKIWTRSKAQRFENNNAPITTPDPMNSAGIAAFPKAVPAALKTAPDGALNRRAMRLPPSRAKICNSSCKRNAGVTLVCCELNNPTSCRTILCWPRIKHLQNLGVWVQLPHSFDAYKVNTTVLQKKQMLCGNYLLQIYINALQLNQNHPLTLKHESFMQESNIKQYNLEVCPHNGFEEVTMSR